ncbi:MAG: DUF3082 domain-containing protein [Gloeocapsa sp. DLM2.Bin57]|nr:MAG: DUF3082 domain-containing protein [Gloeocapsa sp. DLM2.Bin57]
MSEESSSQKVTPWRCLVGASLSGGLAIAFFAMLRAINSVFAAKPITSTNPIIINISITVRTLVSGLVALGGSVFGIVAIGLILLGIQLIIQKFTVKEEQ